jgi:hypothetical protein
LAPPASSAADAQWMRFLGVGGLMKFEPVTREYHGFRRNVFAKLLVSIEGDLIDENALPHFAHVMCKIQC